MYNLLVAIYHGVIYYKVVISFFHYSLKNIIMEDAQGTRRGAMPIAAIIVVLVIIALVVWALSSQKKPVAERAAESALEAVEKVAAPAVEVPTSQNPVKQVLPKETPLEKTNPFNKTYVNPFE
mgnify:FL=1